MPRRPRPPPGGGGPSWPDGERSAAGAGPVGHRPIRVQGGRAKGPPRGAYSKLELGVGLVFPWSGVGQRGFFGGACRWCTSSPCVGGQLLSGELDRSSLT